MLHAIWVRHHLRPGQFWQLPRGEQLFLMASMELELEAASQAAGSG
ncbi:hypothetical protein [Cohnella thailandensis]|uniref:Phage tail assembly chaperone n=1 Tax=Cohnella thailandensis TaxID=557557 RepID=A0A841T2Y0_9BACL|nr:hypothetical protein [Cohnella thailandensis]MBB6637369.1 hypothetical protein [Cohnella thailandensis]MBP1976698.1 hypothetical protein [Cohnella thailandensis]